jgi:hypothetical protein
LSFADFGLASAVKAKWHSPIANRESEDPPATAGGTDLITPQCQSSVSDFNFLFYTAVTLNHRLRRFDSVLISLVTQTVSLRFTPIPDPISEKR